MLQVDSHHSNTYGAALGGEVLWDVITHGSHLSFPHTFKQKTK